jgi:biotin operon repressor
MIPKSEQASTEDLRKALENAPEQLKQINQWVNWSRIWNEDKEKFNKPPMKASGRNGSSTDEATWTTLEKSLAAFCREGVYVDNSGKKHRVTLDGVGFAGLGRTPYTGIDLDHCIDPKTGEINPAAKKIVEIFDSYTEITPSGVGLRIWIEADKSPTWSANKSSETEIEVYDKGRFFTVTGRHLEGTPRTIEARQEALDAFMVEHAPAETPKSKREPYTGSGNYVLDLDEWLEEFGVMVLKQARDATSERAYYIVCPWAHEHTGGDKSGTKVGQYQSGALWFKCHHGHCDGRKWDHCREELDPEAYRKVKITIGGRKLSDEEEAEQKAERAEEAWAECAELAGRSNLTWHFAETLKRSGVAGESNQIRLLQLSLNSRHLDKPVSVAVKGPSSGGKSHLVERVVAGFPESAVYELTSMSEKALIYLDEDMRHRFLVIYEASGMEGDMQTYLIRSLLSENRIRYQTAESTPQGVKPRLLEMEGPTGLMVTTTRTRMHPENETRLLSIYVTDTRAQTKEIFRALAEEDREEVSLEEWKSLQTWIEGGTLAVSVPFGKVLAEMVPPLATRLRRDFGAVLRLIKSHALLHRATRETDAKGRIVATLFDYTVVRELVADLVSEGVGGTVRETIKETVRAVAELTQPDDVETVSLKKIAEKLELDRSATQRRVKAAADEGYLVNSEDQRGKAAKWSIGEPMPTDVAVLPTRENLEAEYEGVQVCNATGGERGGRAKEGCATEKGVHCTPPPDKHTDHKEETRNPIDKPNNKYHAAYESEEKAQQGKGGNGTAHLHTPTHSVEKEGGALHNAHPLHTPKGSSPPPLEDPPENPPDELCEHGYASGAGCLSCDEWEAF